jgi:peptide/nickel transport system permease protein
MSDEQPPRAPEAPPARNRRTLLPSSGFLRFVGRRAVALVLLAIGITLVVFLLTQAVPADPATASLGEQAAGDPAAVAAFKAHYGLDKPLPERYAIYLGQMLQGDLGESTQSHNPVRKTSRRTSPPRRACVLLDHRRDRGRRHLRRDRRDARNHPIDHTLRVVSLGGISMPTFWIALLALYIFFFRPGWFPGGGRLGIGVEPPPQVTGLYTVDALLAGQWSTFTDALDHLVLPALVLAAFNVSLLTRYTRSSVLEVVGNDYVRAARAKGLPESIVVTRYVLRAALPAVVTVIGLLFANILTGAVLVENIFSWPGVGQYAYISAINLDVQAIAGVSLFVAIVYVTINFIVDVLYGIIDPRIRLT